MVGGYPCLGDLLQVPHVIYHGSSAILYVVTKVNILNQIEGVQSADVAKNQAIDFRYGIRVGACFGPSSLRRTK